MVVSYGFLLIITAPKMCTNCWIRRFADDFISTHGSQDVLDATCDYQ